MLIKCPECAADASSRASACPHCGYGPLSNRRRLANLLAFALMAVMGIFLLWSVSVFSFSSLGPHLYAHPNMAPIMQAILDDLP